MLEFEGNEQVEIYAESMHFPDRNKMALSTMQEIIYSEWALKFSAFTEVMSSETGMLAGVFHRVGYVYA